MLVLSMSFDKRMLDWSLSSNFKLGNTAYEDVYQPGQDKCVEKVRNSHGFYVPTLSGVPPKISSEIMLKVMRGLEVSRAIYESIPPFIVSKPFQRPAARLGTANIPLDWGQQKAAYG